MSSLRSSIQAEASSRLNLSSHNDEKGNRQLPGAHGPTPFDGISLRPKTLPSLRKGVSVKRVSFPFLLLFFFFFFCTTPSRAAKPLPLPALYVWERCWLRGEVAKSHVTHWQVGESGLVGPRHPDPGYSVDFPVPSAWVQSLLMGQPWGVSAMAR